MGNRHLPGGDQKKVCETPTLSALHSAAHSASASEGACSTIQTIQMPLALFRSCKVANVSHGSTVEEISIYIDCEMTRTSTTGTPMSRSSFRQSSLCCFVTCIHDSSFQYTHIQKFFVHMHAKFLPASHTPNDQRAIQEMFLQQMNKQTPKASTAVLNIELPLD